MPDEPLGLPPWRFVWPSTCMRRRFTLSLPMGEDRGCHGEQRVRATARPIHIDDISAGTKFQQQLSRSNIRFILRIGTQAMEPAILWFERRAHRVKRLTSGKLLRPCGGLSKGGDYPAFQRTYEDIQTS